MKEPYRITHAPSVLHRLGVRYHAYGTLKNDEGVAMYDYYKVDVITSEQLERLREWCPFITTYGWASEYAPEMRGIMVVFPKAGFFRLHRKWKEENDQ